MKIKLIVVQGRPAGKSLVFARGEYFLGRGLECHVRFNSDWVSRQHCLLRVTDGGTFLRDLGSRNGTLINGGLVTGEQGLRQGDQIQIGPAVFEVRFDLAPSTSGPGRLQPVPVEPHDDAASTLLGSGEGNNASPGTTTDHPLLRLPREPRDELSANQAARERC
jgi:pSer/pThr/pTyr-binding forkhead associated (FHA) protein